jgi:hypothetical protein
VDLEVGLEVDLLKLDLKEMKFLVLLRTHTAVGEPKAAKGISMSGLLRISLSSPLSIRKCCLRHAQSMHKTAGPRPRDIGPKSLEAQWEASGLRLFLF